MSRPLPALLRAGAAIVGAALVVALLVAGATGLAGRHEARQAHADAWERAVAVPMALEGWLRRHLRPLSALAISAQSMTAAGAVDPRWSATLDPFVDGLLAANARLSGLAVMTAEGRVRRYRRDGPPVLERWSDRPVLTTMVEDLFERARTGHAAPVWGHPVRRAGSGHALFNVRVPLLDDEGEARAVLMAMIDLEALDRALPPHLRRADLTPYILYGPDRVLAHRTLEDAPTTTGDGGAGRPLAALESLEDPVLAALARAELTPLEAPFDPAPARVLRQDTPDGTVVHIQRVVSGFGPEPLLIGVHMPMPDPRPGAPLAPWAAGASAGTLTALLLGGLWLVRRSNPAGPGLGVGRDTEAALLARPVEETEASVLRIVMADTDRLAQVLPPERALATLRAFMREATLLIGRHGGSVTHSEGGCLTAVFNLPDPLSDHAEAALAAAIALQHRLEAGPVEGQSLRANQGVATGTVLAGPMGAPGRPVYGVLGPAVDLAVQLEAMTVRTGTRILVSDRTADLAPSVRLSSLGKLPVPGQPMQARIHTPIAAAPEPDPASWW